MYRYIVPIVLIGISIAGFMTYVNPLVKDVSNLRGEIASYNEALDNAKALENERDKLTKKSNSISLDNLAKLEKLLPDSIDNIRLVLEIEKIASPYGMTLKDVKYDAKSKTATSDAMAQPEIVDKSVKEDNKEYGTWGLEFSTKGSYANFLSFVRDLENNLRIVDISSISFSSGAVVVSDKTQPSDVYQYNFKIKTYWLKN